MKKNSTREDIFMLIVLILSAYFLPLTEQHKENVLLNRSPSEQTVEVNSPLEEQTTVVCQIQYSEIYTGIPTPVYYKGEIKFPKRHLTSNGLPVTNIFPEHTEFFFQVADDAKYCLRVPVLPKPKVVALLQNLDHPSKHFLVIAQVKKISRHEVLVYSRFATKKEVEETNRLI